MLQNCSAARLVLPVLLSGERPFIVHPPPRPRADATDEEVAAIGLLFKSAGSVQVNGAVAVSELDKLLEDPADELQVFAPAWRELLAAEGAVSDEVAPEKRVMLSQHAFLVKREQAIASAAQIAETEGEQMKLAESETAPDPISTTT